MSDLYVNGRLVATGEPDILRVMAVRLRSRKRSVLLASREGVEPVKRTEQGPPEWVGLVWS